MKSSHYVYSVRLFIPTKDVGALERLITADMLEAAFEHRAALKKEAEENTQAEEKDNAEKEKSASDESIREIKGAHKKND